jgi:hypothetical protein
MVLGTGLLLMAQVSAEARRLSAAVDHMTWTLAERFMAGSSGAIEG